MNTELTEQEQQDQHAANLRLTVERLEAEAWQRQQERVAQADVGQLMVDAAERAEAQDRLDRQSLAQRLSWQRHSSWAEQAQERLEQMRLEL